MASKDTKQPQTSGKKLQKRNVPLNRLPSSQIPARLRFGDDAQEDVTAPSRGRGAPSQYMNQSIFGMIAAAGSRTDFHKRFDESSDSEGDGVDKEEDAAQSTRTVPLRQPLDESQASEDEDEARDTNKKKQRLSLQRITSSVQKLSSRPTKTRQKSSPSPNKNKSSASDQSDDSSRSDPRDAPMMSRLLTAEAQFEASDEVIEQEHLSRKSIEKVQSRAESSPATLLATRLMEIFGFEKPETVIAEYPCWLLQSVLLQGYLYLTRRHICFYAYLPKKSSTAAKTGYLSKRGRQNPKYRRYWFELKGDVLSYYTNPSDRYFPQGNIDLRYGISAALAATEKEKHGECRDFSVTTDQRTYYFRADSTVSAREWVKSLQKTIFRSHNDGDSVKISLPVENVIDVEESPVVEFAETIKIRVIESDDSYAIDEYFFSFFSFGKDVLDALGGVISDTPARRLSQDLLPLSAQEAPTVGLGLSPKIRPKDVGSSSPRGPASISSSRRENIRATITPYSVGADGRMAPRMSGEFTRSGVSPTRAGIDASENYGRSSFDRGRRTGSTGPAELDNAERRNARSPLAQPQDSNDSYVASSVGKETDSSAAAISPSADARMSASQILTRSDVFHAPAVRRMSTLLSTSTGENRRSSEEGTEPLDSDRAETGSRPIDIVKPAHDRKTALQHDLSGSPGDIGQKVSRTASPTLQDLVKAGSYPLQRAGAFAGYLKNRSGKMSKLLATESMSYLEKVSGMWAGSRRHYGENEGIVPDDRDVDPEDEEANVGYGDRFRAHFALPTTEKLQATYFGYLHRVLPLYGKIYISNNKFCFRSLLPGTRTKLILPLKDVENVDKEKGFRFGYHGLVLVIRGYEELFFEFSLVENRDDCTVTLLHSLETARYLTESGILAQPDLDAAEVARAEHKMLQEARKSSGVFDRDLGTLPDTAEAIYSDNSEVPPVLFDDGKASIVNFKPSSALRITCLTIGSRGDVQPYIALCKGLLAEGHRPRIATHAEFGPWIEKHGIDFVPIDGDPAELMRICVENGMFTYSFLREATSKFRTWIDDLLTSAWLACQDSEILIESPSAMAGIHIAEALGIPYFRAFTMPWTRTRAYPHAFAVPEHKYGGAYNYLSYVMFDNVFWKGIAGQINRWRKRDLGLGSTNLEKMQQNKVPFLYNFSPHVVVPPLDYSDWVRVTGYWFLDEGDSFQPPEPLVQFIQKARADGKKLVYIGFGSIVVSDPAALTKTVVDSVIKADVRCILSKGWSDRLGDPAAQKVEVPLPAEIFQIKAAPHDWLFQQIDAAVHHGGAGTTGASLRAGVPTVVKPFFGDQFFFGSRIEDLGVGICLKKINVSVLARALWESVHSERMIVKARLLGEQIRKENGVQTAIQAIYRDLEYARTLVKSHNLRDNIPTSISLEDSPYPSSVVTPGSPGLATTIAQSITDHEDDGEEAWTFVNKSDSTRVGKGVSITDGTSRERRTA